jgi:hypothetical protein
MGCYKTTNNVTRFLLNENRGLEIVTDRLGELDSFRCGVVAVFFAMPFCIIN